MVGTGEGGFGGKRQLLSTAFGEGSLERQLLVGEGGVNRDFGSDLGNGSGENGLKIVS